MNKNILTEQINSNFKILKDKPANVLKRIKGVVSDNKSNRNGRIYPIELWKNVVNSDYVKEMIDNHSLFGEADHPETRLEISLQNVSHAINDLWIDGDKVMAIIDILPTPMGKILSELLDYGTNLGISSRGAGTVLSDNTVDPDDYQFVTFDFVARPSCEAARLNTILESATIEASKTKEETINGLLESYKSELSLLKEDSLDNPTFNLGDIVRIDLGEGDYSDEYKVIGTEEENNIVYYIIKRLNDSNIQEVDDSSLISERDYENLDDEEADYNYDNPEDMYESFSKIRDKYITESINEELSKAIVD